MSQNQSLECAASRPKNRASEPFFGPKSVRFKPTETLRLWWSQETLHGAMGWPGWGHLASRGEAADPEPPGVSYISCSLNIYIGYKWLCTWYGLYHLKYHHIYICMINLLCGCILFIVDGGSVLVSYSCPSFFWLAVIVQTFNQIQVSNYHQLSMQPCMSAIYCKLYDYVLANDVHLR